ncbi:MAG: hypothetical protein OXI01_10015 [Albidovulum sp.]|nr:hypothetical protein [Albidovulum sp.]
MDLNLRAMAHLASRSDRQRLAACIGPAESRSYWKLLPIWDAGFFFAQLGKTGYRSVV